MRRAFIALGSNMGDRFAMIEKACWLMDGNDRIRVRRTSGLWETKAMYVLDQADFLNGVCEVQDGPFQHDLQIRRACQIRDNYSLVLLDRD